MHSFSDTDIDPFSQRVMGRPLVTSLFRPHLLSRTGVYYLLLHFADQLNTLENCQSYSNTGYLANLLNGKARNPREGGRGVKRRRFDILDFFSRK